MEKDCLHCANARLACGDMKSLAMVACVCIPDNMGEVGLLAHLHDIDYTGKTVGTGWCYHQCTPGSSGNGMMASGYPLVEVGAVCKNFVRSKR